MLLISCWYWNHPNHCCYTKVQDSQSLSWWSGSTRLQAPGVAAMHVRQNPTGSELWRCYRSFLMSLDGIFGYFWGSILNFTVLIPMFIDSCPKFCFWWRSLVMVAESCTHVEAGGSPISHMSSYVSSSSRGDGQKLHQVLSRRDVYSFIESCNVPTCTHQTSNNQPRILLGPLCPG